SINPEVDPNSLANQTLTQGLEPIINLPNDAGDEEDNRGRRTVDMGDIPVLLIFDQFEEIFNQNQTHWEERTPFFEQIRDLIEAYPTLHVLFSMREDYIAEMTPYVRLMPDQLRSRFRLERLKRANALQAIEQPAASLGRFFDDGVAESLVDNLRRTQLAVRSRPKQPSRPISPLVAPASPEADGAPEAAETTSSDSASEDTSTRLDDEFNPFDYQPPPKSLLLKHEEEEPEEEDDGTLSEFIEPVHLQIVCRQLWNNLPKGEVIIVAKDVKDFGDVDQALQNFL
ncbi:MAG: hypothetical protein AAF485_17675, partial [Chloroflexota bacterium]